jgi:hypothetical protein
MKNLKEAVNYIKAEEANSKKRLIRNLNKPIVQLRYSNFEEYVDYVIRNSNMDRKRATFFVKNNTDKYKK